MLIQKKKSLLDIIVSQKQKSFMYRHGCVTYKITLEIKDMRLDVTAARLTFSGTEANSS